MGDIIFGLAFAGLGAYIVYDAKKNGATTRRAKIIAGIFGEKFAKGFYVFLGYALIVAGVASIIVSFVDTSGAG